MKEFLFLRAHERDGRYLCDWTILTTNIRVCRFGSRWPPVFLSYFHISTSGKYCLQWWIFSTVTTWRIGMVLLKLYGYSQSPNVRRVTVVLLEKGVPFEFVDVERGELKSAEYLKLHPFGQMPCIVRETHVHPAAPWISFMTQNILIFFRTTMDLFSTKAKQFAIISLPSIRIKELHYFQLNSRRTRSSIKPYQYLTVTSTQILWKPYSSYTTNRKSFVMQVSKLLQIECIHWFHSFSYVQTFLQSPYE